MDKTLELLKLLSERKSNREFGYGIGTAENYVRAMVQCMDDEVCKAFSAPMAGPIDPQTLLKAASETLTYTNEDMVYSGVKTSTSEIEQYCKDVGVAVPPRTIMVFENVVTTPRKDRDGDVLVTEGAKPDPKMPLLWHHMLPMPIGKMLKIIDHSKKRLYVASAIIDSELGNNAAALVEFGALRISHGFQPKKFERMDKSDDDGPWGPGYKILEFEIMEESLVSVPSNVDAVITAFSRGKLTHPLAKAWGKTVADSRNVSVPSGVKIHGDGRVEVPAGQKDSVVIQSKPDGSTTVWLDAPGQGAADDGEKSGESCGCNKGSESNGGERRVRYCSVCEEKLDEAGACQKCAAGKSPEGEADHGNDESKNAGAAKESSGVEAAAKTSGGAGKVEGGSADADDKGLKQGRALSKANESKLEQAGKMIDEVLSQVKQQADDEDESDKSEAQYDVAVQTSIISRLIGEMVVHGDYSHLKEMRADIDKLIESHEKQARNARIKSLRERLKLNS